MKFRFFLLMAICALFISCQKENTVNPQPPPPGVPASPDSTFLRQFIGYDGSTSTEIENQKFEYDEYLRLKSITSWKRIKNIVTSQYEKNVDTILFFYTGPKVTMQVTYRKIYDMSNTLLKKFETRRTYIYNMSGDIMSDTTKTVGYSTQYRDFVYLSPNEINVSYNSGSTHYEDHYILNYSSGNNVIEYLNGIKVLEGKFDDKHNPFNKLRPVNTFFDANQYSSNSLMYFGPMQSNIITQKLYSLSTFNLTYAVSCNYTYRNDGFPLTVNETYTVPLNFQVNGKFIYY